MNIYNGSVFFVDILGFSSLTKGDLNDKLQDGDYTEWSITPSRSKNLSNNELAAAILIAFRESLEELKNNVSNIEIAQLSDCAFIWSKDTCALLQAVHFFMKYALFDKQILCRGGISYGEIIEDNTTSSSLGKFIVGNAVTNAVKNEGKLKGPRVTMDQDFVDQFWTCVPPMSVARLNSSELFKPIHSLINGDTIDEYRWYIFNHTTILDSRNLKKADKINLTKERLKLAHTLCCHPKFNWNTYSKEGLAQMNMGMEVLSQSGIFGINHDFKRNEVLANDYIALRTNKTVQSFFNVIDREIT